VFDIERFMDGQWVAYGRGRFGCYASSRTQAGCQTAVAAAATLRLNGVSAAPPSLSGAGKIENASATPVTVTFGVNGFNIATTASTTFTPACGDLKSGNKVKVRGITQADGSVRATSVTRQ
jgi:hypothetical protein